MNILKVAVLYYSRTQKTAVAAKALADKLSGDLIEIKDLKNRKGIIGWIRAAMDARGEKTTDIEPSSFDTSNYNLIFIGTPVWAGKPAPAINTVMNNFDLKGKDITLFATLGGSNYVDVLNLIKTKAEANGGNVVKIFAVINSGKKNEEDIKAEISNLEI